MLQPEPGILPFSTTSIRSPPRPGPSPTSSMSSSHPTLTACAPVSQSARPLPRLWPCLGLSASLPSSSQKSACVARPALGFLGSTPRGRLVVPPFPCGSYGRMTRSKKGLKPLVRMLWLLRSLPLACPVSLESREALASEAMGSAPCTTRLVVSSWEAQGSQKGLLTGGGGGVEVLLCESLMEC